MIKAIKGTNDILPEEIVEWNYLINVVQKKMQLFNYKEIRTPIFEHTALFSRGIGESTDIVSKEMYSFTDRSENNVTLKPEMTASVVRAFIEHSLGKQSGLNKLFYISPMFRQERPQAGRLRQFHQFGIEAIGSHNPMLDAEVIQVAFEILRNVGLEDLTVTINSLGIPEERAKFSAALKNFIEDRKSKLSEDSQRRLDTNVLRILDSKDRNDQNLLKEAPSILDFLGNESLEHFENVKALLKSAEIPFIVEPKLVRGLDYYTHTTFEITSTKVGSQSALCGGGRYNLLVEQLEGPSTPAVGFAAGIERILLACKSEQAFTPEKEEIDIYLIRLDNQLEKKTFEMASFFRGNNLKIELDYSTRSVKAQMREANKYNARFVVFIGGEEFENGQIQIKNMQTGDQTLLSIKDLEKILQIVK
ncbi:MAG: histidine--tRNA ligase [Ignavibacteriae bacterium]|nr:histidine--tRNA ligase [Ignavibacteriota bacterium]MCB9210346.1 histidine--tRNA ligase [Ignavibacteriales bacterium]